MARSEKASPFGRVKKVVVNLFLGANLVTLFLLWICCATTWISPFLYPHIAFVSLAFPVFLVLNICFVFLWLVYKPKLVTIPILGMALCGGYILDYYPLNFLPSEDKSELSVLTWNVYHMANYQGDSLLYATDYVAHHDADIMCLQEHMFGAEKYQAMYDTLKARGYYIDHYGGLVLISRFPILNIEPLPINTSLFNGVLYADLLYAEDTLTVFNVHLESYAFSPDDKDQYQAFIHSPERNKLKSEIGYFVHKIGMASSYRANQVKAILHHIDSLPDGRSVLLCGDFNDTPISYAYQTVNRCFENAFRNRGCGVGISYNEKFFPVRIDHIFYSSDWQCTGAYVDRSITASDHYPVVAGLKKRRK